MTTKTNYKPCPRSWGDGYTAGYSQAIRDAAAMLETEDNHSILPMTALEQADSHARICSKLAEQYKSDPVLFAALTDSAAIIRALIPKEQE